jgi:hypothetical protein
MIIHPDPAIYGEWDLSPFGFKSHFGQVCLSESKFELLVFLTSSEDFFIGHSLVGKHIEELKGVCSGKRYFLIHPRIIGSETYSDGTTLLKIQFTRFLRKIHLDFLDEPFISGFSMVFGDLWDWKDRGIDIKNTEGSNLSGNILLEINLKKIEIQFREVFLRGFFENKYQIEKKFQIDIYFREEKGSLKDLEQNIEYVTSLLELITGMHLNPDKISLLYREGEDVEIVDYFNCNYNESVNNYIKINKELFLWKEIEDQLEKIFINFYDSEKINKYFLVNTSKYVSKKILQPHEEYLNLTRMVEGTHRSNTPGGNSTLKERLVQIYKELLPSGLIEKVEKKYDKKIENVIEEWRLMRNILTHLDGDRHETYSSRDIVYAIFDMRMTLHVYLLFILGIDLQKNREIFARYFF